MSLLHYMTGFVKNLFNRRVSLLALVDSSSSVHPTALVYHHAKLFHSQVDAYSYITPGTELTYARVGRFCSVGRDSIIGLPTHSLKGISTSPVFTSPVNALKTRWVESETFDEFKTTTLGSDVWIGSRAIVMGGVNIGHGAVIGAGAIVTKDIPDYAIAVGVPATVISYRFDEATIHRLQQLEWWNWPEEKIKRHIAFFTATSLTEAEHEYLTQLLQQSR